MGQAYQIVKVKVPALLLRRIRREAARRGLTMHGLVRYALAGALAQGVTVPTQPPCDAALTLQIPADDYDALHALAGRCNTTLSAAIRDIVVMEITRNGATRSEATGDEQGAQG
jgi:hypothetical protein